MAILDELFVRLGFDGSAFIQGTKKAGEELGKIDKSVTKSGHNITDMGKQGADAFAAFRREALGALALFTGGASIAKFTGDIAQANTALGNLSRQLDIAPQKLTQLHEAAKAAGVNPGDVDSFFTGVQNKFADPAGRAQLMNISGYLGIDPVDQKTGHVHTDLIDQIAHSKVFQGSSRAVQDDLIQQLGGPASLNNLVSRKDYDALKKRFDNLGPTREQIKQGEQLLADWTELKANTNQVMQQTFSDLEPTIHQFLHALIAIEKAHPKEIADGIAGVASALTVLSALLTAKSFLSVLSKLRTIGGGTAAAAATTRGTITTPQMALSAAAIGLFASSPVKGNDTKAIDEGYAYENLVQHYKKRTGAWTALSFDENKEKEIVRQESTDRLDKAIKQPPIAGNIDLNRLTGAVAMQESGGNPYAINKKTGARGMMQFMPATAHEQGLANPFDAQQSWAAGERYLQQLINRFHDGEKALAAYNWGQGNVAKDIRRHGSNWRLYLPRETSDYLAKVGRNYATGNVVHNNNSNTNNVTIAINGAGKTPHEIAQEISRHIPQQTAINNTTRMM